jgi:hypothetical protein
MWFMANSSVLHHSDGVRGPRYFVGQITFTVIAGGDDCGDMLQKTSSSRSPLFWSAVTDAATSEYPGDDTFLGPATSSMAAAGGGVGVGGCFRLLHHGHGGDAGDVV